MKTEWWKGLLVLVAGVGLLLTNAAHAGTVVTYVHTDHLGSPVAETNSLGNVTWRRSHSPYGEDEQGPTPDGPGYTGHRNDAATGLVYMQARYYDPEIGRFLSVDPVTFSPDKPQQFNRYWYADGNPIRNLDPTGQCSEEHSKSKWECDLEDAIAEKLEPIIEQAMEAAGVDVVPEEDRDPEGEYSYEAPDDQSITTEISLVVLGGIKSRLGGGKKNGLSRKPGKLGKFKSRDAHKRENKQARDAASAAGLNKDQRQKLHREIGGRDLTYHEIVEVAREIKNGG